MRFGDTVLAYLHKGSDYEGILLLIIETSTLHSGLTEED